MINKKVYLAGPITGTSYDESVDWRKFAKSVLSSYGLIAYSPMRGKAYLSKEDELADAYNDHTMSSITAINIRDKNDVITAGALLVNFLNSKKVSIGTVMEVAWAQILQIPVVLVMEKSDIHYHGMLTYNCIIVSTLEEGIKCIQQLLND